jgi:hypothetical protein
VIETSFSVLGEVAMRELTTDPKVASEFEQFGNMVDAAKLEALFKEAGLNPPPSKP